MSTQQSRNIFTEELCKYFMDFLQSGFKSTRFPKRYIRLKDEKNFKIGINLSKYENFNESIRKILNKPEPFQQDISVKKGTHTVKLNDNSIDLLKKLTKQIKDKDIDKRTELMGAAYVKDCGGGDRMMKLNTMEGRLLSRQYTLVNQYLKYKRSKKKEI